MAVRLSRRKVTSYIAEQLATGTDATRVINELAAYLIDSKRTKEAGLVVRDIEYELQKRGIVVVATTSAFDLSTATKKAITDLVAKQTGATTIQLHEFIDPGVLGGVKVDIPGRQLDATIHRKLTLLRNYKK